MNKRLSNKISVSFFVNLVEMSLYSAYMVLFLSTTKMIGDSSITKILAINSILSLFTTPIYGWIIEKNKSNRDLVIFSTILHSSSLVILMIAQSMSWVVVGIIMYHISKNPIMRLQDMLTSQAHHDGEVDYGVARSVGSIGYSFAPLFVTLIFRILGFKEVYFPVLFFIMALMLAINAFIIIRVEKQVSVFVDKEDRSKFSLKSIGKETWGYLIFIVLSGAFFHSANGFATSFQAVYLNKIFNTTSFLGIIVLFGSFLEWPLMKKTTDWIDKLGYLNAYLLLPIIQIFRWFLYYQAGAQKSMWMFMVAATLNGVLHAIFIPLNSIFIRKVSTKENYGSVYSIVAVSSGLVMWMNSNLFSFFQDRVSLESMYLVLIGFSSVWVLVILLTKIKEKYSSKLVR